MLRLLNERRYRAALAATDCVIARLEELNLEGRGKEQLGRDAASHLERVLAPVPTLLRPRMRARTVQHALEAVFEMQESLLEGRRKARGPQIVDSVLSAGTIAS